MNLIVLDLHLKITSTLPKISHTDHFHTSSSPCVWVSLNSHEGSNFQVRGLVHLLHIRIYLERIVDMYQYSLRFSLLLCRWWPGEVVFPNSIPDNLIPRNPGQNMFVVRFCGSHDYCWTYHGRTLPYTYSSEGGKISTGRKWLPAKKPGADVLYRKGGTSLCVMI